MKRWIKNNKYWLLLIAFIICVFTYTVVGRPEQISCNRLGLFWSYREAFINRNKFLVQEVILNIGMLVPAGYILSCAIKNLSKKYKLILSATLGVVISSFIEISQYFFFKGTAEADDVFSNTLGAILGCILYIEICKVGHIKLNIEKLNFRLSVIFVVIAIIFCISMDETSDSIFRQLAFQATDTEVTKDELEIKGFCFTYGYDLMDKNAKLINVAWNDKDYDILLKSVKKRTTYQMKTITNIYNHNVNKYFKSKYNYPDSGFRAYINLEELDIEDEYEIMIKSGRLTVSGNTYIKNGIIEKTPENENVELEVSGTDLEEIVKNGYLKAYNKNAGIIIYQYGMQLFWILDENFDFNATGKSEIEYRIWTTQLDRIRSNSDDDKYWDDEGFMFEDREITHIINCGEYRVASMKLPSNYSIAFITTGSITDGTWNWVSSFRPRY